MAMPTFRTLSALIVLAAATLSAAPVQWKHLSSEKGDLPNPGGSNEQTGILVARLDKQAAASFVISYRVKEPALVWIRRVGNGWQRYVIEKEFFTVEAGGAAFDIDGDGDLDIVFGEDAQGNRLWWWENPFPQFDPDVSWKRHIIKSGGAKQHHDQIFADLKGTGKPQLIFWNQKAKTLFLADIPAHPKDVDEWPLEVIYSGKAGEQVAGAAQYAEGLDVADIDGDGKIDLLAGNYWFKYRGGGKFEPTQIGTIGGRIRAGMFRKSKYPQVVIAPGDGSGPLRFYEAKGDPTKTASWVGRDLLDREMIHGHTLDVGDVDGDGNLDIFAAEMTKWTRKEGVDNPGATAWILYGDGKGNFRNAILVTGHGWHEGRLADVDGDGDLDVINKPYTWNAPRVDLWINEGAAHATKLPFRRHLGMELWTYRRQLAEDLPGTLRMIRSMGFTDVETASFYKRSAAEFRQSLDEAGLTCSSYIAGYERLRTALDDVAAEAATLGARYVLTAGIPRKGELTAEDVERAAADFNAWGERLKKKGLQFGYHPHGFEFVRTANGNLFDELLAKTRPEYVVFELDTFWMFHGGADPVHYLERNPGRFPLMHLKDMAKGTPTGVTTGKAPDETSVALGKGMLNWPAILRAADKAGAKLYYLEDESPEAPSQVPVTIQYLEKQRF